MEALLAHAPGDHVPFQNMDVPDVPAAVSVSNRLSACCQGLQLMCSQNTKYQVPVAVLVVVVMVLVLVLVVLVLVVLVVLVLAVAVVSW
ncbi:hypothetical protein AK812_SmicGene30172 [Symbiodinium microadriaticum]|uniref:Uncharacterized protein n=1 Tax=Symbiodinium microadriaticum TaxID=2951 RepID=A0A1Q9CZX2_SYMMI|nr:hypothetical protein AK812_SmicGene30174 [Symbiodinium microadriaticum]OLP88478.1 hypothetical protein AK812_SmicGene30172 [Symbiodinium microadriaticum]